MYSIRLDHDLFQNKKTIITIGLQCCDKCISIPNHHKSASIEAYLGILFAYMNDLSTHPNQGQVVVYDVDTNQIITSSHLNSDSIEQ